MDYIIKDKGVNIIRKDKTNLLKKTKVGEKKRKVINQSKKSDTSKESVPRIFICYSSEDNAFANDLYMKLSEAGFQPWLDTENLKDGDDLDRKIKMVINDFDFFVVIQSHALEKKPIGYYVNKEINWALDRKDEFRMGLQFIIPIKIDDSQPLEDLSKFQFVDLSDPNNLEQLISVIKLEYKKRNYYTSGVLSWQIFWPGT